MPCLIVLLTLAFPRFALALLFLFSNYLGRAYHSLVLVALGFVFLPLTTIVYAWVLNSHHPLEGIYLVAVIVSVFADLGFLGNSAYQRKQS